MPEYRSRHGAFVCEIVGVEALRDAHLDRIASAHSRNKRRWLVRSFFSDTRFKSLYLLRSVQAKGLLDDYPPELIKEFASSLSVAEHTDELVTPVNIRSRQGTRRRTTYNFGPRKHALQNMVADVLKKLFPVSQANHFTIYGGVRAVLLAVQEHAQKGFVFAVERDIEQFYPSVNFNGLVNLLRPLPQRVVMNVIAYSPGYRWAGNDDHTGAMHDAPLPPRGLLAQGSAASPVAAEVIMADLLRGFPDDVRVMSYADNILILGETLDRVQAANCFLEERALAHAAGPLGLKPSKLSVINSPVSIHFLGHQGHWEEGALQWEPDEFSMLKLMKAVEQPQSLDEVLGTIEWLKRWRRGYPVWADGDVQTARYIAQLGARLAMHARNPSSETYRIGLDHIIQSCQTMFKKTGAYPALDELLPDDSLGDPEDRTRPELICRVRLGLGIPPTSVTP